MFKGQKQLIESTVSSKRLPHQRKHSKVQNGPGRDETCGLRFVTIKTGSRKITSMINDEMVTVTIDKIKRLRYCYECGRSIGKGFVHCVKCPNTKFFLVRIQSECGKMPTRKISVFGHFSHIWRSCYL